MGRTIPRRNGRPGLWRRRAALWYVLATSYALTRLLLSRTLSGVWELDEPFLVELLGVTLVQLAALELLQARCLRRVTSQRTSEDNRHEAAS